MIFSVFYSDLLDHLEDIWTGGSQSVGESVLAHDEFFLRSFGMVFHSVAELETRSLIGSYGIVALLWSDEKTCIVHSIWIAELKLESYN